MPTDINIVALLTQSFSQASAGNPALFTGSSERAGFDQVLGQEFDRSVAETNFTPRESTNDRTAADPFRVREKVHSDRNDRVETPVRSDRPGPPEGVAEQVEHRPAPFEDAPTGRSDQPVNKEPGNPQTAAEANTAPPVEALEAEPSQVPANESSQNLTANQQALRDQLEKLNIDPEIIDTLLENLVGNPKANGLLRSLYGLLNATGAQAQTGPLANAVEGQTGLPASLALQNLIQAGLNQAQAQKVIQQSSTVSATQLAQIENGPLLATLPPVNGLKGNATEAPGEKLPVKLITPNVSLNQSNAESKSDSNSNNASNANSDPLTKLASLLRNDANPNPATSATSPFKAAVNAFLNLNGATPLNSASAEGLAIQTGTAVASAGKSTEVFKPVLAQTYGQRGSVEKTVASQIIERISFRGMGSQKEIHIKLDPPSLGSVRVTVATTGDSVRTTIVTENHFVKHVIENNLPQLKDSLASQGIKVDQFSVLVGGNPEQNTAHQQESAGPKTILGPDHEDPRDTGEELVLTQGHVIFNESTINVFA